MKLLIVLSLISCGYGDKLDRTYLPPSNAATAGGNAGFLNAPAGPESSRFGQPAGTTGFGQSAAYNPSSGSGLEQSNSGPTFGAQSSKSSGYNTPSSQYGQPEFPTGSSNSGFSQSAQNFGGQGNQDYQRSQPQRSQASAEQNAEILRFNDQNDGETFSYSFETSNGIAAEESGVATNGVQAQGAFSYSDDDGQAYRVTYTADENGYQPQGDHLPTPHPVPEEILKSIEQNAQAAAAGTQEGAYNPNEDNSGSSAQQYSKNAPSSYSQGSSGTASYNQAQRNGPNQLYGAPNSGASRPQFGGQNFQPQASLPQNGASNGIAPSGPLNSFTKSQTPSQFYGSSSNSAPAFSSNSALQPNNFNQPQDQSQQYSAPRPGSFGAPNGFAPSGTASNGFGPSGSTSQSKPSQYQAPNQSGFSGGRTQDFAQNSQAQSDSGYQYNKPQSSSFGLSPNARSQPSIQGAVNQYQNGAKQTGSPSSYPKSEGYPSGPVQSSFGPSENAGSFGSPSSSNGGNFGPSSSQSQGPNFKESTGLVGKGTFGSPMSPQGSSSFGPSTKSNSQNSFGYSAASNGSGRPQNAFMSPNNQGGIPDSGYSYNRPGSQSGSGFQKSQGGSNSPGSGVGQNFGGPRQPPSFSEEEGYKY